MRHVVLALAVIVIVQSSGAAEHARFGQVGSTFEAVDSALQKIDPGRIRGLSYSEGATLNYVTGKIRGRIKLIRTYITIDARRPLTLSELFALYKLTTEQSASFWPLFQQVSGFHDFGRDPNSQQEKVLLEWDTLVSDMQKPIYDAESIVTEAMNAEVAIAEECLEAKSVSGPTHQK